jgi:hypothetical protein
MYSHLSSFQETKLIYHASNRYWQIKSIFPTEGKYVYIYKACVWLFLSSLFTLVKNPNWSPPVLYSSRTGKSWFDLKCVCFQTLDIGQGIGCLLRNASSARKYQKCDPSFLVITNGAISTLFAVFFQVYTNFFNISSSIFLVVRMFYSWYIKKTRIIALCRSTWGVTEMRPGRDYNNGVACQF